MIDYKEFCDRFWLAANDQEQQQLYSYRFGKKSFFARSNWLSSDLGGVESRVEEESEEAIDISIISSKSATSTASATAGGMKEIPTASTVVTKQPTAPAAAPSQLGGLGLDLNSLSSTFAAGAKISLNTRHMSDLTIQSARLTPNELEQGEQCRHGNHHGQIEFTTLDGALHKIRLPYI